MDFNIISPKEKNIILLLFLSWQLTGKIIKGHFKLILKSKLKC